MIRKIILLIAVSILLAACAPAAPAATVTSTTTTANVSPVPPPDYWPTEDWRTSLPEERGMDNGIILKMQEFIKTDEMNLHSLLIIRGGYIVNENYYGMYHASMRHELYSVTKSFTSTLIGILHDQGRLTNLDQAVVKFFPGKTFRYMNERKQAMTLMHLLSMTSGLNWKETDASYSAMYMSDDWIGYVMDLPMHSQPGSQFLYCSGCSHILSAVVHQASGGDGLDYADRMLFSPLGIQDYSWETDNAGIPIGGWGLKLTPRDMAKLGFLFLHEGQWDGTQIVSTDWVANATQKHVELDGGDGYGFQWWIYPRLGGYAALGRYGQTIFVVPGKDLVIVATADLQDGHDRIFQLIEDYIIPAAK